MKKQKQFLVTIEYQDVKELYDVDIDGLLYYGIKSEESAHDYDDVTILGVEEYDSQGV